MYLHIQTLILFGRATLPHYVGLSDPRGREYHTHSNWISMPDFFLQTGNILTFAHGHGLNCSNFVIIVFQSTGIALVDLDGWELRDDDSDRQRELFDMLCATPNVSSEHLSKVVQEVGKVPRVRPEEVAGACLVDELPAYYLQCKPNGEAILSLIDQRFRTLDIPSPPLGPLHLRGDNTTSRTESLDG